MLVDTITVIGQEAEIPRLQEACREYATHSKVSLKFCVGGASRQESVRLGLESLDASPDDVVLVHDGARPLVAHESIANCIDSVIANRAAIVAMPIVETLKRAAPECVNTERKIARTLDREDVWSAQTPQGATFSVLTRAFKSALSDGFIGTDEASLLERLYEVQPSLVEGTRENIKITSPQDLRFAEHWLKSQSMKTPTIRIGNGYDIHRLVPDRPLVLGGVQIESDLGLLGHSDADVVLHAICDALLGAAGMPDIGNLFPNDDPAYENADSAKLLETVVSKIGESGYKVGNVDCCVIAERPKISKYTPQMKSRIASVLGVDESAVGIKATTNEGLGSLGAGEGIACHATAILFACDRETQ